MADTEEFNPQIDKEALKKLRLVVVAYSHVEKEMFATKQAYEAEVEVEEAPDASNNSDESDESEDDDTDAEEEGIGGSPSPRTLPANDPIRKAAE